MPIVQVNNGDSATEVRTKINEAITTLNTIETGGIATSTIQIITSTTKPTVRIGGGALAVGDIWYNPATLQEGFWNGTYWLGMTEKTVEWASSVSLSAATIIMFPEVSTAKILTSSFVLHCLSQSVHDASNYFTVFLQLQNANNTQNGFATTMELNTINQPISTNQNYVQANSSYANMATHKGYRLTIARVGTAQGWVAARMTYREVL